MHPQYLNFRFMKVDRRDVPNQYRIAAQSAAALVAVHGRAMIDAAHFAVAKTRQCTDDFAQHSIAVGLDMTSG